MNWKYQAKPKEIEFTTIFRGRNLLVKTWISPSAEFLFRERAWSDRRKDWILVSKALHLSMDWDKIANEVYEVAQELWNKEGLEQTEEYGDYLHDQRKERNLDADT